MLHLAKFVGVIVALVVGLFVALFVMSLIGDAIERFGYNHPKIARRVETVWNVFVLGVCGGGLLIFLSMKLWEATA